MAGPQKVVVPIPFAGGLDTKTDPAQVRPGKFTDLQNAVFRQTGSVGRRWGYKKLGQSVIGGTQTISACKAIQPFNNELVLYDGTNAYSYIKADDAWAPKGSIASVIQSNQQIIAGTSQQLSPDFGTLGGIEVYAWEDSRGGIRYSITDAATGTFIVADQPLFVGISASARAPKIIPFAAAGLILVFFDDGFGDVAYCKVNPSNPALANMGAETVINGAIAGFVGSAGTSPVYYDVALSADGASLHVAAAPTNAVNGTVFIIGLDSTLHTLSGWTGGAKAALSLGTVSGPLAVSIVSDSISASMIVACGTVNNGTGHTVATVARYQIASGSVFTSSFFMDLGVGTLFFSSITAVVVGSTVTWFAEIPAASSGALSAPMFNRIWTCTSPVPPGFTVLTPSAPVLFKRGCGLASKPFKYGGSVYLNVAYQSNLQSTYFTLDASGNVVGKVFSGLCGGVVANSDYMLPECPAIAPGIFKYANLIKGAPNTSGGTVVSLLGVNATKLDFFDSNTFQSAAINGSLYTVGGVLQVYDGAGYVESGFHIYPENLTLAAGAGGGQSAGTYYYAATYEWSDNNGRSEPSSPSVATPITLTAGQSVTVTVPTLRLTKKTRVRIVVYRTTANGTLLYRVTSALLPLYNDPNQDTLSLVDVLADSSITSNGLMYTQPLTVGSNPVVPNIAPPSCSIIATYSDRLFLAGVDDQYSLWYSQASLSNAPMQFSSQLVFRTDPDGGPITALARMDDKLVIFKSNAIFYFTGAGPTPNGDQNDFGTPVSVPSGQVGCISPNSLVLTPVGLLFQSNNGIYLLDRGLNVSYKGAPVEKFNALAITSATLVPNQWVIFTTTTGQAIVYDYYYDQWSTFTNHNSADAALYLGGGNLYAYGTPSGQVMLQTPSTFTDNGTPIPWSGTTAPITPAALGGALQGYQRVYHAYLLGTYKGTHTLTVGCAFDGDASFTALAAIPSDTTLGVSAFGSGAVFGGEPYFGGIGPGQDVYQFRIDILRKCQSIQFQISDSQPAPGNEGFALSALSLVVGVKRGGNKLPATKQFGAV